MPSNPGLSDYLAAERTLLAWTRTALALMGFGFVVARFGLFLAEFQRVAHSGAPVRSGFSLWFGTAMIAASVLVNLLASWQHTRVLRSITAAGSSQPHSATLAVGTSMFLAAVGLAMAVYLISVRGSARMESGPGPAPRHSSATLAEAHRQPRTARAHSSIG